MQYTVILSPEETGFSVFCPAFGVASQGDNRDHALAMIVEAMGLNAESEIENGRDLPVETLEIVIEEVSIVLGYRAEEGQDPILELTQVTLDVARSSPVVPS